MSTLIIMVQIANRQWTLDALHRACILARAMNAEIALMQMLPVQHVGWLGTQFAYMGFTEREKAEMRDYSATVEDYGVPYAPYVFQYVTLPGAISEAADYVDAQVVFATLPKSIIPYWQQFQLSRLRDRLARQRRQLLDPDHPAPARFIQVGRASPISAIRFLDRWL